MLLQCTCRIVWTTWCFTATSFVGRRAARRSIYRTACAQLRRRNRSSNLVLHPSLGSIFILHSSKYKFMYISYILYYRIQCHIFVILFLFAFFFLLLNSLFEDSSVLLWEKALCSLALASCRSSPPPPATSRGLRSAPTIRPMGRRRQNASPTRRRRCRPPPSTTSSCTARAISRKRTPSARRLATRANTPPAPSSTASTCSSRSCRTAGSAAARRWASARATRGSRSSARVASAARSSSSSSASATRWTTRCSRSCCTGAGGGCARCRSPGATAWATGASTRWSSSAHCSARSTWPACTRLWARALPQVAHALPDLEWLKLENCNRVRARLPVPVPVPLSLSDARIAHVHTALLLFCESIITSLSHYLCSLRQVIDAELDALVRLRPKLCVIDYYASRVQSADKSSRADENT